MFWRNSPPFVELECLLPCSQESTAGFHSELFNLACEYLTSCSFNRSRTLLPMPISRKWVSPISFPTKVLCTMQSLDCSRCYVSGFSRYYCFLGSKDVGHGGKENVRNSYLDWFRNSLLGSNCEVTWVKKGILQCWNNSRPCTHSHPILS
jgi:hypothetical protein